ncbi:DUF5615 family PIN-like protein [Streptomyces zhihengii]
MEPYSGAATRARQKHDRQKKANDQLVRQARAERRASWPAASSYAEVISSQPSADRSVSITTAERGVSGGPNAADAAGKATVSLLDQKAARRAGVSGVLLTAAAAKPGAARVTVDYSGFASAIGGNWATRLGLVELPACALTTPEKPACREQTLLSSSNDVEAETVTARARLAADSARPTVLAVTATAAGAGAGDFKATPLAASSTWQAGKSSGSFSWSYPLILPPAASGRVPTLSLNYDSGSTDGRSANTNNQGSLVGEGFSLTDSYVERKYGSCDDDGQDGKFDLCWKYENASLVLNGQASELVKDDTSGEWRLKNDDASTVTRHTGAENDDEGGDGAEGEYWTVVTGDGTKYTFGLNKLPGATTERTNSVWTVPVFGDDSGEPGFGRGDTFAERSVLQAWRWNLDLVEDTRGGAETYWYKSEANHYAKNGDKTELAAYTRGGYLAEIRYGQRRDTLFTGVTSAKVGFTHSERCDAADCESLTEDTADNWPDVPFDSICSATETDCRSTGPTFFTRKRIATIDTSVWSTALEPDGFKAVDSYGLTQEFFDGNDIGNSSDQVLTLTGIKRTGKNGTALGLPAIGLSYQQRPNRVTGGTQPGGGNILDLTRPRLTSIVSESGATTSVTYNDPECVRGTRMPAAEDDNNLSCYPVYWPINGGDVQLDWFHKYRVTAITTDDPATGNLGLLKTYEYSSPGWHYSNDPLTKEKHRTWSQWRGYQKVTSYSGPAGSTRSKTVSVYLQGMHGDKLKDGGTRSAVVGGITLDNDAAQTTDNRDIPDTLDRDVYSGQLRQQITYDGNVQIGNTVNDIWYKETASQQKSYADIKAYYVRTSRVAQDTYLTAAKKWRTTGTSTTYDPTYGMATRTEGHGDWDASGDETCTRLWYARNNAGLTSLVSRTRTVGQSCSVTDDQLDLPTSSSSPGDVLSDTAVVYDDADAAGWSADQTPTVGLPTWTGRATAYPAAVGTTDRTPALTGGWQTQARTAYDGLGRPVSVTDALGQVTSTSYFPADTGPLTSMTVTLPKLSGNGQVHKSYSFFDPARGVVTRSMDAALKTTEHAYDALGRLTATWLPNRPRSTGANATFDYLISQTDESSVAVSTLDANGDYHTSYEIYDSLLRPVQTQRMAATGGRILTNVRYDQRGLAYITQADAYDSTQAPNGTYTLVAYAQSPNQTEIEYDGAGRATKSTLSSWGVKKWHTTAAYTGDSVASTAVQGGNATRMITDALGRTVETRTYAGTQPDDTQYGATLGTTYTRIDHAYFKDGKQKTITAPDATKWTYAYDLFGRPKSVTDPDKGTSTTTYDVLDRVDSTVDSDNRKLLHGYDEHGRKTGLWHTARADANKLAAWTYDAILKGSPDASTRYVGGTAGKAYTKKVTAYDTLKRATSTDLVLPADDPLVTSGAVSATSTFGAAYRLDGTLNNVKEPAVGGLPAETVETRYNPAGLPIEMSGASNYVLGTSYTPLGQVNQLRLGASGAAGAKGVFITNTFEDGTGRLLTNSVDDQTRGPVQDLVYSYDQVGNVQSIFDHANAGAGTDHQCFAYDTQRRLTEAWTPRTADCAPGGRTVGNLGGAAPYWSSYTYNASGQRATEKESTGTPLTTTYCYDPTRKHALLATTTSANCAGVSSQYTYDNAGNTTRRAESARSAVSQNLSWNHEGKLAKLTEGAAVTDYLYDADGELLIRRDSGASGETVLYLGSTEVHLKSGKKWANRYYAGMGSTVAVRSNETGTAKLSFLASDHHGTSNLAVAADTTQTLSKRYTTPFGSNRGTPTGAWPDDKGFLGMSADTATGLTHIGAREYDASTGQFVSVDPILNTAETQSLNGYSYAGNNPTSLADPTGLDYGCGGGACEYAEDGSNKKPDDESKPDAPAGSNGGMGEPGTTTQEHQFVTTFLIEQQARETREEVMVQRWMAFYRVDGGDYWETSIGDGDRTAMACYGRTGCQKALMHLHETGDLKGAKRIAATYCLYRMDECSSAAKDYDKTQKVLEALPHLAAAAYGLRIGKGIGGNCGKCFLAGTDVLMADGSAKDIEDVELGDKVQAKDPESGKSGARTVTALIRTEGDKHFNDLAIVTADGIETLTATHEHPFWSPSEERWVEAKDLAAGATLLTDDGHTVIVTGNRAFTKHARTYNLTVDDLHTYYVLAGEIPVLVHNSNCPSGSAAAAMRGLLAKKAGFTGNGQRIIVDENMSPRFAAQLRDAGYDARSVQEMGLRGTQDPELMRFAEQVGARVLTRDRGRQMDGGFSSRAVQIDRRITSIDGILRVLGGK